MGVTGLLVRAGAARPHVLVAAMPGGTAVRLAAEEQLRRRGWPAALSPADADVLLVAGAPAADIAAAVEATWAAIPAPRVRALVTSPGEVAAALDAARAELATGARRWLPAGEGSFPPDGHGSGADGPGGSHDAHGTAGHHDMGGMDMEMPAGLPMAERGEDRDGLKLDQLHVRLGPVLPGWPAGLVVRLTLQGDVVQYAETAVTGLADGAGSFWTEPWRRAAAGELVTTGVAARRRAAAPRDRRGGRGGGGGGCGGGAARRRAAAHLDSLDRFLGLTGWDDAAAAARRLRDDTLGGRPAPVLGPAVRRLAVRVTRSRVLAWSTRGAGMLPPGEAAAAGAAGPAWRAGGDVTDRYRCWCRELAGLTAAFDDGSRLDPAVLEPPRGRLDGAQAPSASLLAVLPRLLTGAEFAAARLIVASLDPDLDELPAGIGVRP